LPNVNTVSMRQRRTAPIPLGFLASGSRHGCYSNTAMRIDWRASLVPAAAVIPAPEAYANIAAVKTLVVRLGSAGLPGVKPWRYAPAPTTFVVPVMPNRSCLKSPSVGIPAALARTSSLRRLWWCAAPCHTYDSPQKDRPPSATGAHHGWHPGKINVLQATNCTSVMAGCSSSESQSIDRVMANRVVLGFEPTLWAIWSSLAAPPTPSAPCVPSGACDGGRDPKGASAPRVRACSMRGSIGCDGTSSG